LPDSGDNFLWPVMPCCRKAGDLNRALRELTLNIDKLTRQGTTGDKQKAAIPRGCGL